MKNLLAVVLVLFSVGSFADQIVINVGGSKCPAFYDFGTVENPSVYDNCKITQVTTVSGKIRVYYEGGAYYNLTYEQYDEFLTHLPFSTAQQPATQE